MAFNGSGTFVRAHNWVTDKAATTPVTASRTDTEMDGFATGLSTTITKDGQTVTTARIPFTLGVSLGSGTVAAPSMNFSSGTGTGWYLPATDNPALAVAGTKRFEATTTGAAVTGTLGVSGAATITGATTLTGAVTFTAGVSGELLMPTMPAFLAYNSGLIENVTGNAEPVNVNFDTEIFDRGSDFASDIFTAPVTGIYALQGAVRVEGIASTHVIFLSVLTSNRTYSVSRMTTTSSSIALPFSVLADMDAADTALIRLVVESGSTTIDVGYTSATGGTPATFFSGHLVG